MAHQICNSLGLSFAAVDFVHDNQGAAKVIEVNAIPGWKGAQSVTASPVADRIIRLLHAEVGATTEASLS
jgi:glutathione synthase/RimK-type ligase-like ATP-grasp enzyme